MSKLKKAALWTTFLAILLKVSGFLRESVMAKEFGANDYTDGYLIAFSFVTLIVAMISSGFNHAFLPLYIKEKKVNESLADQHANALLNLTVVVFFSLSIIMFPFIPDLLPFLFPQMSAVTNEVAVKVTSIFLVFMSVIVLSGVLDTYLQSKRSFIPAHVSKLLPTLFAAIFALTFSTVWGIYSLIYGFVFGTILGIFIQFYYLRKNGYRWIPTFYIDHELRRSIIILLIPAIANSVVGQINLFVDKVFATSTISGAVTYLNNASLLASIPFTIFGTTIAAIIFTILSENIDDQKRFESIVFLGMETSVLFLLPISIAAIMLGDLAISFVYERGQFTGLDTENTYAALIYYSPLIVLQGMQVVVSKAFYAKGKMGILFWVSMSTIGINMVLNFFFINMFGYVGLALSSSIVSLYYLSITIFFMFKGFQYSLMSKLIRLFFKVILPSALMIVTIFFTRKLVFLQNLYTFFQLLLLGVFGLASFFLGIYFFYRDGYIRIKQLFIKH